MVAFSLVVVACEPPAPTGGHAVRDSAGIEIVENHLPLWSEDQAWKLDPVPIIDIGGGTDQASQLFRVEDIVDLGDRFAVLHASAGQVLLFDTAGALLRAIGRPGEGPGEFARLRGIYGCEGDTIVADDVARVGIFDLDGNFVRTHPIASSTGEDLPRMLGSSAECSTVLATGTSTVGPAPGQVGRRTSTVFWTRIDRARRDTIGQFAGQELLGAVIEGNPTAMYLPWGADGVTAVANDRYYYGTSDVAEVRVYDRSGALTRIIRWPIEPQPISSRIRSIYSAKRDWLLERFPQGAALMPRLEELQALPQRMPFFRAFLVDDESRLWVRKYPEFIAGRPDLFDRDVPLRYTPPPGDVPETYWVFDAQGRWLGQVETPAELAVRSVEQNRVTGVWRDELDIEHVRVYRLNKPGR
jgi:6-bladed beta-propeller